MSYKTLKISEMDEVELLQGSEYFEVIQPQEGEGYRNRKLNLDTLKDYIGDGFVRSDELDGIGGGDDVTNMASLNGDPGEDFSVQDLTVRNILPSGAMSSIGSPEQRFDSIWVDEVHMSTNTLYIGDTPIMGTENDTVLIKADPDQSITIRTSGNGRTNLISRRGVDISTDGLNSDVLIDATGNGGKVRIGAEQSVEFTGPSIGVFGTLTVNGNQQTTGDLTVSGDLTVNGERVMVDVETVRVTDNMMHLNYGESGSGVTSQFSGIEVDRGNLASYQFVFDESDHLFKVGMVGDLEALASRDWVEGLLEDFIPEVPEPDVSDKVASDGSVTEWLESLKGRDGLSIKGEQGVEGQSAYEVAVEDGFEGTVGEWLASLIGERGPEGKNAYEVAVAEGFEGSVEDWLESLTGPQGKSAYDVAVAEGFDGSVGEWLASLNGEDGKDGVDGVDGRSAYDIAVSNGFQGGQQTWLASLKGSRGADGEDGLSSYEIAVEAGFEGSVEAWLESIKGEDGKDGTDGTDGLSAYDIAVEHGFEGSEGEWLASLNGKDGNDGADGVDGTDGLSSYELAVNEGFEGTVSEWLASLVGVSGPQGKSAYDIAVEHGFEGSEGEWLESLKGSDGGFGGGVLDYGALSDHLND